MFKYYCKCKGREITTINKVMFCIFCGEKLYVPYKKSEFEKSGKPKRIKKANDGENT